MTRRTIYVALLALLVGGSAAVPLEGQTHGEGGPAVPGEDAPDRAGELVTVHVLNDSFSIMRIYVVETAFGRRTWRLGSVTGLSKARFEIPEHLGAPQQRGSGRGGPRFPRAAVHRKSSDVAGSLSGLAYRSQAGPILRVDSLGPQRRSNA